MSCIWTFNPSSMFGFRPGLLLGDFKINVYTGTTTTVPVQFVGAQPDRFGLYFCTCSGNAAGFSPILKGMDSTHTLITVNQLPMIATFPDYGPLICLPWWVIQSGAANTYVVYELIYQPKGDALSAAKISPLEGKQVAASLIPQLRQPSPRSYQPPPIVPR